MPTTTTPQVRFRTVDRVQIRYADSGGSREPAVLLTSPWPESVHAFAPMWATLAQHARMFAVDLGGMDGDPHLAHGGVDLVDHRPNDVHALDRATEMDFSLTDDRNGAFLHRVF